MSDRDIIPDIEPPSAETTSNAFLAFVWLFVMVIQVEPGIFLLIGHYNNLANINQKLSSDRI